MRNGGWDHPITLNLRCSSMVIPCLCSTWVPLMAHSPSQTDSVWASHRLELSKHCSSMALYQGTHPSDITPHVPMDGKSPSLPAPQLSALLRLQLWPGAIAVGVSMGCAFFRSHPLLPHGLLHGWMWRSLHALFATTATVARSATNNLAQKPSTPRK